MLARTWLTRTEHAYGRCLARLGSAAAVSEGRERSLRAMRAAHNIGMASVADRIARDMDLG